MRIRFLVTNPSIASISVGHGSLTGVTAEHNICFTQRALIKIRNEFPDAIVMNNHKETETIEFEINASDFITHGHDRHGCDFIVCCENDLEEDRLKNLPEVISIKDNIEEFM